MRTPSLLRPVTFLLLLLPVAHLAAASYDVVVVGATPAGVAAAGIAAAMVARDRGEVRTVDVPELQRRLHEAGAFTVYITDLFPAGPISRPEWDPRGPFTAHFAPWPIRSEHAVAAQFFGTRGFFHGFGAEERYQRSRGAGSSTGQWGIQYAEHREPRQSRQ
jgi:hypothetical protein